MKFENFKLNPSILKALRDQKYTVPTPIQEKSIPLILDGKDILGSAQTGTGKTAAFAIPIIQNLSNVEKKSMGGRKITALIITPTRELAIQIGDSLKVYSKYTNIKNTVIYGGVSQVPQLNNLKRGVDILVATPGRLADLMNQGHIYLNSVKYFVLDEADRMLDMGFIDDIKKIIAKLPKERQSLFFSATMPKNIVNLSRKILTNPTNVLVNPISSTAEKIKQSLYKTNKSDKKNLLLHILKDPKLEQVLLFSKTKYGADHIVNYLKKKHIGCDAIHGNKSQNQRQNVLKEFKSNKIRVLVATDIASRGIDIDKLQYVINYDIPNESETYVHRIGRCGRAGEEGNAISLCEPEENEYVRDIEKLTRQKIHIESDNPYPQTDLPMTNVEKKKFAKKKEQQKQDFFANRKKKTTQKSNFQKKRKIINTGYSKN